MYNTKEFGLLTMGVLKEVWSLAKVSKYSQTTVLPPIVLLAYCTASVCCPIIYVSFR